MRIPRRVKTATGHVYSIFLPDIRDDLLKPMREIVCGAVEESK